MLKAKHKTGLVFFPAFDWAISPTHPEREERLLYTQDQVFEEGVFDIEGVVELKPDPVTLKDIQRTHFCVPDVWQVTTESHFISAGGAKTIGMAVLDGQIDRGFALVRPPGHHAMRVVHGARGFCNINIEAVMIEYLRQAYAIDRVAIVDTDCHHGDGTQDIYWHDPDTLFISLHQDGRTLYPGSGFPGELGGINAVGQTLNIPLPPHTSEEGFLYALKKIVMPVLNDFNPDLIINSAGQDNHYTDPITNMNFSAQGYADLTAILKPDIAVLEGGYSIEGALPYVNLGIVLALAGVDYTGIKEPNYDPQRTRQTPEVTSAIEKIGDIVLSIWQNKEILKEQLLKETDPQKRTRTIFYDTDGIQESQAEHIQLCPDCAGALRIDSSSDRGARVLAIHIPRKACSQCKDTGYRWYEKADPRNFDGIYLQDRTEDLYLDGRK
jgi:acetoin utilization deacetylase AcuC-like enzyme